MVIKHGRYIFFLRNSRGAQRFVGFFLDFIFRVLIGWANKLRSRGIHLHENVNFTTTAKVLFAVVLVSRTGDSSQKRSPFHVIRSCKSSSFPHSILVVRVN